MTKSKIKLKQSVQMMCSCAAMASLAFGQWCAAQEASDPGTDSPIKVYQNGETKILMNFKDASLEAVLTHLSAEAGLVILNAEGLDTRVNLISQQPVTLDEAVDLINSMLKEQGMTAVRRERLLRIISLDDAKGDSIPVRYGNDPQAIGYTDTIITQVIPVKYADANEIQEDLEDLVSGSYAEFTANEASNALILTDTEANVRRIVEIVAALDKFISNDTEVRVFKLEHAEASATASLIENTFQSTESASSNNGNPWAMMRARLGGGGGGGGRGGGNSDGNESNSKQSESVAASADDRTNSVVVSAGSDLMAVIADVIEQLDRDASVKATVSVRVFQLEYADATDAARLIEETFSDTGETTQNSQGRDVQRSFFGRGGGDSNNEAQTTSGGDTIEVKAAADERTNSLVVSASQDMMPIIVDVLEQLDANTVATESVWVYQVRHGNAEVLEEVLTELFEETDASETTGNVTRQAGGNARGQQFGGGNAAAASSSDSGGTSLAGQVTVVADPDTNSLAFLTPERNFSQLKQIMEKLDRPVEQVLIRVLIAEVSVDDETDIGVEWDILDLPSFMTEIFTDFGVEAASGGLKLGFLDAGNFSAAVRLLQEIGSLDVLSRPYILASDNQEASISVGESVPFVTDSRVTDTGQTINTIEYRDLGIILNVTPRINSKDQVTLDINQELSALTGETVAISELLDASVVAQRIADTRAAVLNGQTIVIGGLMEDQFRVTTEQVPGLGDIPLLGYLFKRERTVKSKTELLIFLTPEIVETPDELDVITEEIQKGATAAHQAIHTGALQAHLDKLMTSRARALSPQAVLTEDEAGETNEAHGTQIPKNQNTDSQEADDE